MRLEKKTTYYMFFDMETWVYKSEILWMLYSTRRVMRASQSSWMLIKYHSETIRTHDEH